MPSNTEQSDSATQPPAATGAESSSPLEDEPDTMGVDSELAPAPRVVRRDKVGRTSVHSGKRFSNIISCYIPMSTPEQTDNKIERRGLLEEEDETEIDASSPSAEGKDNAGSTVTPASAGGMFQAETLLELSDFDAESLEPGAEISNIAVLRGDILLTFNNSYTVSRVELPLQNSECPSPLRLHSFSVKVKGEPLLPTDIKVIEGRVFVSGSLQRDSGGLTSVLVECSPDGALVRATKELPYPKFAGFDLDTEGNLLVASPMQTSSQGDVQVFKMSADFRRKLFKIELGGRRTRYKPQYVAVVPSTNTCWVSAQRSEGDGTIARGRPAGKTRLLSFPIRNPASVASTEGEAPPTPTREWLKVASWKFESVDPGRVAAFGEHLLVLDATNGNLLCVTRPPTPAADTEPTGDRHMCQPVTAPVKEGGPRFTALCVDPTSTDTVFAATADTVYKLTLRL